MSHQDFAAVWTTLHCRVDIDNILQELIGRYVLEVSEHSSNRAFFRATAFRHVVALRTIFDLQRTYLQSRDLSSESNSSLLSPDVLFSAIKHLLQIKILAFCAQDDLPEHVAYCSFIGQTLVSGIRALHMRNRQLSSSEYEGIINKFKQAWSKETLSNVDHFSINHFCYRMLGALWNNDRSDQLSNPACGIIRLPDFSHGLYPLDDTLEQAAQTAMDTLRSSTDWFYSTLVLYDISWATTAAVVQMCMDNQYYEGLDHGDLARNVAQLTLSSRFKMLDQLFKDSNPFPTSRELAWSIEQTRTMLCMSIRADCFGQECECLGAHSIQAQGLWRQLVSNPASKNIINQLERILLLNTESTLKELQSMLNTRHAILPDVGKELLAVSQKVVDYTNEWCTGLPNSPVQDGKTSTISDDIYIVNCSELHAVSNKLLVPNIIGSGTRRRQASLSSDIQLLKNISLSCTQCSYPSNGSNIVSTARKVEPLSKISAYLQEKLKSRRNLLRSKVDLTINGALVKQSPPQTTRNLPPHRQEFLISHSDRLQDDPIHELPTIVNTLQPIVENNSPSSNLEPMRRLHRSSMSTVDMRGTGIPSPPKPSSPATTFVGSVGTRSHYSDILSRPNSRKPTPPLFPTPDETTDLPEVVAQQKAKLPSPHLPQSVPSDTSSSIFPSPSSRKWPFKTRRKTKEASSIPSSAFFTSGKALILWNDQGACFYDLQNMLSASSHIITSGDILLAAGGTQRSGVITRIGTKTMVRIFQGANQTPILEREIDEEPFAMALSINDHYLALKFGNCVSIIDTTTGELCRHDLPSLHSRCGPKDHLVGFSTDCLSFAAATRYEPEKVITYFCECRNSSKAGIVESSAPYGLVGDDGLSSIVVYSGEAAFITTFTEKGYPAYLTLQGARATCRLMRENNQQIGARIHSAALCATGQNLVLLNDRNEIFWIDTPFGKENAPTRLGNIKREKSVKREVELAMPSSDEVHIFWIHKGKGVLMTMGRRGGKSKPVELNIDMDRLLE